MTSPPCPPLPSDGNEAVLTIDLDAVAKNYRFFRDKAKGTRVGAVLKSNAYGLGAGPIARTLVQEGCDLFFVATAPEAVEARKSIPPSIEIYTLNGYQENHQNDYVCNEFYPILNSLSEVRAWVDFQAGAAKTLPCGLQIDTGMKRTGLPASELRILSEDKPTLSCLNLSLVLSHLACADDPGDMMNQDQLEAFEAAALLLPKAPLSLANSAGILAGGSFLFDVVRLGIGLFGGNPLLNGGPDLATVAFLHAPILQVREIEPGESVGYGATYRVTRPSRIATIGVGYGDGYLRHLSNTGYGMLGGTRVPIAGRISMDLTCFDVTDAPTDQTAPGVFIELLGDKISVDTVGKTAGTFGYEILTSLGTRYVRRYVREGKVVTE